MFTYSTFERPNEPIMNWFTKRLPPAPENQKKLYMNWHDVWKETTLSMVLVAFGMLVAVLTAIAVLSLNVSLLRISVVRIFTYIIQVIWHHGDINKAQLVPALDNSEPMALFWRISLTALLIFLASWLTPKIPRYALLEEQTFRQGSENWTARQRVKSSVLFGFAHVSNLWYTVASFMALSVGGMIFTSVYLHAYRRTGDNVYATKKATTLHSLYNGIAVTLVGPLLIWSIWFT